jgi:hypothetical protein
VTGTKKAITAAFALYVIWTGATWIFEGRIETLLRPDAVVDRLSYAVIANVVVGIVGAVVALRFILNWLSATREAVGFGATARSTAAVALGLTFGFLIYWLSGGATADASVIANAFAQVFVVSAAEVMVCWAVVGSVFAMAWERSGPWAANGLAAVTASVLFGVYHFAHSAPFNSAGMVAFLSVIGLLTSLFFFLSRDVYGTVAFHNFLGVRGVVDALEAKDQLQPMLQLQMPLLLTALVTIVIMVFAERLLLRNEEPRAN